MQMQPAPMPPMGMAIWVACSPLKVRCGPLTKSSAGENAADSVFAVAAGAFSAGVAAAAMAAEEVAFKKSRREGFFEEDMRGSDARYTPEYHRRFTAPPHTPSSPDIQLPATRCLHAGRSRR